MSACSSRSGSRPRITRAFSTDPSVPTIACTTTCALDFRAHRRRRVLRAAPSESPEASARRACPARRRPSRNRRPAPGSRDLAVPAEPAVRVASALVRSREAPVVREEPVACTCGVGGGGGGGGGPTSRLTAASVAPEESVARAVSAAQVVRLGRRCRLQSGPEPVTAAQRARLSAEGGAGTDADTGTGRTIDATVTSNTAATPQSAATGLDSDMGRLPFHWRTRSTRRSACTPRAMAVDQMTRRGRRRTTTKKSSRICAYRAGSTPVESASASLASSARSDSWRLSHQASGLGQLTAR